MLPLEQGSELELAYPIHTHVKDVLRSNFAVRHVIVHRCRDLVSKPLTPTEFVRRPYVARSRWLIQAYDIDLREWRNFYLGSSQQFRSPGVLRLGLYEPGATRPYQLLARSFEPTPHDRRVLLRMLVRLTSERSGVPIDHVRVFADDMRIH